MRLGNPWRSLRNKVIAWSFIPSILFVLMAALVTLYAYFQVTDDLVTGRNRELTRLSASQLAADLAEYSEVLNSVARGSDLRMGDPDSQQGALERARNRLVVFDGGVMVFDNHGTVTAALPERADALGQDWSDRAYFRLMLRTSGAVFSDAVADGPGGQEVILVAVPILGDQGEFRGALAGMFQLGASGVSAFYGGIVRLRIGETGSTYLVDTNGRVIYHSDSDLIGTSLADQPVVQQLAERNSGNLRTGDLQGRDILATYSPVPGTPWGLVSEENWTALISANQGYGQFLLFLLFLGVAVPALVVTLAVRRITGPIATLIQASKEVAQGNFGRTVAVSTGDELEELAQQFNLMSSQLQESYANLERKVEDRTKELATLNSISAVVSRFLDLEELMDAALEKTLEVMGMDGGGIYLLDRDGQQLILSSHKGLTPQFVAGMRELALGESLSGWVAQTGQPLVTTDVPSHPRLTRAVAREQGHQSLASVPLFSRGKVIGAMFVATRDERDFSSQDLQLLTSIGHQVAVGVENARLFEGEQKRAEQFQVISEVGRSMTSILAVEELLKEIVHLIREKLGFYMVQLGMVEGEKVVIKTGEGACWEDPGYHPPALEIGEEGIIGKVASSGEPMLAADVTKNPCYMPVEEIPETCSELAVPLITKEGVIGVLDVQSDRRNAFDESDLLVLQSLAQQAAIAIENAWLYQRAQQLAVVEERNRLARDLHDSVTQAMYGATLYAEAASRLLSAGQPERAADHLQKLKQTAQEALREMRLLIFELRPPVLEKMGLVAALQIRLEAVEGRSGMETELAVEGDARVPPAVEDGLYRIAQEALNNALKHAHARLIGVRLYQGKEMVALEVYDDGEGFDVEAVKDHGGMGMSSIEERAAQLGARLVIDSSPGKGTKVRVEVSP